MKKRIFLFAILSISLISCEGPVGSQGPQGRQGEQGPRGPEGPEGSVDVITKYVTIDKNDVVRGEGLSYVNIPMPEITPEIYSCGVVKVAYWGISSIWTALPFTLNLTNGSLTIGYAYDDHSINITWSATGPPVSDAWVGTGPYKVTLIPGGECQVPQPRKHRIEGSFREYVRKQLNSRD